jgi:hypothetical protein
MYPSTISDGIEVLKFSYPSHIFSAIKIPNKHLYLMHQTDCSINKLFLRPKIKNIAFDWD